MVSALRTGLRSSAKPQGWVLAGTERGVRTGCVPAGTLINQVLSTRSVPDRTGFRTGFCPYRVELNVIKHLDEKSYRLRIGCFGFVSGCFGGGTRGSDGIAG